jgi:hypothetical protein
MKKTISTLSVEQRIRAAIHATRQDDPAARPSVSALCRMANVNRAGLYAHHQDLLREIRPETRDPRTHKLHQSNEAPTPTVGSTVTEQALLLLCLELQLEVRALRALAPRVVKGRKRPRL